MSGWGTNSKVASATPRRSSRLHAPSLTRAASFLLVLAIIAAFHGIFIVMLMQANARNWLDTPAAVVLWLVHMSVGSMMSVWLARALPRVLNAPMETRWISVLTTSFVLSLAVSAWLGYTTFEMIPTHLLGLRFGIVGLFVAVPCSAWFWQLGKTFSW